MCLWKETICLSNGFADFCLWHSRQFKEIAFCLSETLWAMFYGFPQTSLQSSSPDNIWIEFRIWSIEFTIEAPQLFVVWCQRIKETKEFKSCLNLKRCFLIIVYYISVASLREKMQYMGRGIGITLLRQTARNFSSTFEVHERLQLSIF